MGHFENQDNIVYCQKRDDLNCARLIHSKMADKEPNAIKVVECLQNNISFKKGPHSRSFERRKKLRSSSRSDMEEKGPSASLDWGACRSSMIFNFYSLTMNRRSDVFLSSSIFSISFHPWRRKQKNDLGYEIRRKERKNIPRKPTFKEGCFRLWISVQCSFQDM